VPKAPHILTHTVKALKSIPSSAAPSKTQYLEARNALGETFGTKKQKATIRAQERNRIDVGAMEGVMGYVMDSIEKGAEGLMTAGSSISLSGRPWYFMVQQRRQKQWPTKIGSYPLSLSLPPIQRTFTVCMISYQKLNGKPCQPADSTQPKIRSKEFLRYLTDNRLGSTTISQLWPRLLARKKIICRRLP
jgi:hypothetical protein